MLTIEGILIPVRSGCNCILFSDLNLTPHFQQWQYSNWFEKSWLSFWMISKYHHPPHPPHSTQRPVYLQWSAITDAFRSLNHEAYLELFHHCQTHHSFSSRAPDEQGLLFCVIKETHIECSQMHINFLKLFHVWFGALLKLILDAKKYTFSHISFSSFQMYLENMPVNSCKQYIL